MSHTVVYYARAVSCPTCLAQSGKQCRSANDNLVGTHIARVKKYNRLREDRALPEPEDKQ